MHMIGLDFEKLKYPNNGLYTFCYQLGALLPACLNDDEQLYYYMPEHFRHFKNNAYRPIPYRWYDRYSFRPPHTHVWHAIHQNPNVWPRKQARRIVMTLHDLNFLFTDKTNHRALLRKIQSQVDDADKVVAISAFTLECMKEHLRLPEEKTAVVYNGASVNEFPLFDAPRYRPAAKFLFTIGMLTSKKNFHVLPALLKGNDYELLIAGSPQGNYVDTIKAEAARHGVSERVKLLGAISEKEKYWYYKNCSAFLFPSLAEGFGIPVIEAMRFGKPAFISDKTSLPEVGGDVAYYFRDFDEENMRKTLEAGLAHYAVTQPEENIKSHAAQFSWEKTVAAYLDIYRSLY